jgi:hypothetical protein
MPDLISGESMRKLVSRTLIPAISIGFAAGCSSTATRVETPMPAHQESAPAATATSISPRGIQEEAIVYSRTGGFAGISELWRFFGDGRVIDAQDIEYVVSDTDIADLLDEMDTLGFFTWEFGTRRLGSCADCFTYSIDANHKGQINQLIFVDGQEDVPEEIWIILEAIQNLLEGAVEKQSA